MSLLPIWSFMVCSGMKMDTDGENTSTRRKTSPNATLSTTDPTETVLGSNLGLSHGTACVSGENVCVDCISLILSSSE